jgi:phosphoglycolate phosphatase
MQTTHATTCVVIQDGFVWDAQDAYLFDIDGTLLRSRDRIHFNSFSSSVREVTGFEVSLSGVVLHGGTDTAILREAFALAGVPAEAWEPQLGAILEAMRQTIAARRGELDLWTMPGVEPTLRHLAGRGALLGLATGNLEMIGWTKVEEVGLREWFRFGGFSDRFEIRAAMVADAAAKARELIRSHPSHDGTVSRMGHPDLLGTRSHPLRDGTAQGMGHPGLIKDAVWPTICVVGDTPRDIEAARANGLPVIAVATGNYPFDELAAMEPEVCTSSLAALLDQTASSVRS